MKKNEILERIKGNIPKITTYGISAIAKLLKESEEYSIDTYEEYVVNSKGIKIVDLAILQQIYSLNEGQILIVSEEYDAQNEDDYIATDYYFNSSDLALTKIDELIEKLLRENVNELDDMCFILPYAQAKLKYGTEVNIDVKIINLNKDSKMY